MSEVVYELKSPFVYATGADAPEAMFIELSAPSYKSMPHMVPIKQAFMAAIKEVSTDVVEDKEAPKDLEITGTQVMQLMYGWSGDLNKIMVYAQELFKSKGVALVDGEEKLTQPLIDKMSVGDFEGMLGAYIANFIAPSLMDGQESSTDQK